MSLTMMDYMQVLDEFLSKKQHLTTVPYIAMEWVHIQANTHHTCPHLSTLVEKFYNRGYTPYSMNNLAEVPGRLEMIVKEDLLGRNDSDLLWVHNTAAPL